MSIRVLPVRQLSGAARLRYSQNSRARGVEAPIYKSSGPDAASAQHSILDTQGEHNALHDDHVSERLRNRKTRLGTRPQKHGCNGQVQRATTESRRAARARRADAVLDDERACQLQKRKIESYRRPVYRNEGSGRRLLDHPGEVARRGARMGLAHPWKG